MPIRIAIVGYGKIAVDQHVPAIQGNSEYQLVAAVSPRPPQVPPPVPVYESVGAMLQAMPGGVDAIAVCTPPSARHPIVAEALAAGLHVLIEKPPAATLGEVEDMVRRAHAANRTLYAAWHAQHNDGVDDARDRLAGKTVTRFRIEWFEDVRKWHPGQDWIFAPGGFGVFDPGINALSISTSILPMPLFIRQAKLLVPANRQQPIAVSLDFGDNLSADFDFRERPDEHWVIEVDTADGEQLRLSEGGTRLAVNGAEVKVSGIGEYPSIYQHFAKLVAANQVEVDVDPLRIVADAFMAGSHQTTDAFDF
ncbi:gfo/Idh/MocA family oxidoreductase [Sphingomonas ginkgonis]|uniref:Gfo/Idh/MocA family oxidoreductase n=1 Tax=Sphingomonas ginkgonis TaxID=2315330 RepID=A0A429VCH8_9SPHN|nr:Gfo/Idh/MocA family oxidoreductase [Sphingomonas ginkgonis]RST31643.1 gfo/Idh/MocA family oxidoreductase [Sphingomonas ginkgonis]